MSSNSSKVSPTAANPNRAIEPRLTREQFNRQLWHAIIPPLLLLAAHAALITLLFMYFLRATDMSRHTEQVISGIIDIERLLANMETGFRGYHLAGDERFLEPYLRARPRLEPALSRLETLVDDHPAQLRRLADLRKNLETWFASEARMPPSPARWLLDEGYREVFSQRNALSTAMRGSIREMSMAERELQQTRDARQHRAAVLSLLGGVGVSLMLGIGLALINRRTVLRLSSLYQQVIDEAAANSRQFTDLAETVPQLIWISDGDGNPTYFNRQWSEYTGALPDEQPRERWRSSLHPDELASVETKWKQSLEAGAPFEGEYRLKRGSDGNYRWFLCRAIPVTDPDGQRKRWFVSCTDIEQQKQVHRDRETILAAERAARGDLLRMARVKDEFLATLSHELRTPMTAILGWVRLLNDPKVREQHLDRAIEAIDSGARAQSRLIDDLLDMSRITSGKLVLKIEQVELPQIVRAALDAVGPAAANKRIALEILIPESHEFRVSGDPARLQQIVWNLLSNAVKFTPAGGKITVSLQRDENAARLIVADTGRGIDPAFLPHVFQRFRQADGSTTRQYGGLGLGLSIVEHLVEMHGGTVSAASPGIGEGATFTVELPLDGSSAAARRPTVIPLGASHLAGKRVLVVDDDPEAVELLRVVLESANCIVQVAHNANEALARLRSERFDAMISDIGMPDVDGYTLIRRLRESEPPGVRPLPAIALSAFARPEDSSASLHAGYHLHIAKPASPDEVLSGVSRVLGTHDGASAPEDGAGASGKPRPW